MRYAAQGFASRDSLLQTAIPVPAAAQMQMAQQMQAAGNAQQPVLYAKAVPVPGQTAGARLLSLNATPPLAESANVQAHARTARVCSVPSLRCVISNFAQSTGSGNI